MDQRKPGGDEAVEKIKKPLLLDMGLGSREQGFRGQKPKLNLVHSR